MATEAQNLRPPPFPFSDLGPCELSWFHRTDRLHCWEHWVFWSTCNDELRCHQMPLLLANGDAFSATAKTIKEMIKRALQGVGPPLFWTAYLVQFWGLVNIGDSMYLTTCDQPFALTHGLDKENCMKGLRRYRKHCLENIIPVDETIVAEGELGPPGRVFRSGLPEVIADVRRYSSKEYPQRDLAVKYVKGYWALPIYQSPGHICIGVLEFVSPEYDPLTPLANYLDLLKEVGLTTNCPVSLLNYEQSSSCHKKEINEINKVLKVVRKTHQIRDARTWIEANSNEQLTVLYQGNYGPCYMDTYRFCFIRKGHGVVGKAFSSQSACFCRDIRQLSITEYPFVPNAREYGYSSCFAICLQSSCLNSCIYTLEFVLPMNETDSGDPRTLLHMIMETLKQYLQSSFKIASGQEIGDNLFVEVIKVSSDDKFDFFKICHTANGESTLRVVEVQNQIEMTPPDGSFQQVDARNNSIHDTTVQQDVIVGSPPTPELVQNVLSITHGHLIEELDAAILTRDDGSMEHNGSEVTNLRKRGSAFTLESARGITLKDLQQRSSMKLVDAAKDLGVSRSTLKRICRRYDIHRWPPHKVRICNQSIDQQEPSKRIIEAHPKSVATSLLDDSNIMVKATYGDDIIKFQLLLSARKMDLEDKVAKGLNLPIGSFRIKLLDEDNEWILVTCDEDLNISLRMLRSQGKTTVRMSVSR